MLRLGLTLLTAIGGLDVVVASVNNVFVVGSNVCAKIRSMATSVSSIFLKGVAVGVDDSSRLQSVDCFDVDSGPVFFPSRWN